ncbi:MAG: hypothetical protein PHD82_11220 [Candidatus Riflebacteria bacterium]|jgi:hypothetical protein|nr:hypothetical protein [Candidatus Riflebacteria bacterium]
MKKTIIALIMALTAIGGYAMIETLSIEQLVQGADVVVKGRITAVKPAGKLPEGPEILACLFEVNEAMKGEAKAGENLKIKNYRGVEDMPEFSEGTTYVLFLKKNENHYEVFNSIQGSWPIDEHGKLQGMGYGKTIEQIKAVIDSIPLKQPRFEPLTL